MMNVPITCRREDFDPDSRDWNRQKQLFDAHAMELRGLMSDLDLEQYARIQREGRLVWVTARDVGGLMVGYSMHFWHRHLHFNIRVAQDDAIYVVPELRMLGIGRMMREIAIEELKKAGVKIVYGRLKTAHPHDDSMKGLGYVPWESVYLKEL
jgi:GNAT superfamily N-acetyltransferase